MMPGAMLDTRHTVINKKARSCPQGVYILVEGGETASKFDDCSAKKEINRAQCFRLAGDRWGDRFGEAGQGRPA